MVQQELIVTPTVTTGIATLPVKVLVNSSILMRHATYRSSLSFMKHLVLRSASAAGLGGLVIRFDTTAISGADDRIKQVTCGRAPEARSH